MNRLNYTSLHGHTDFSNIRLLDCISSAQSVIDRAHELGLNGIAITDHETVSSFVRTEQYLDKKKKENPEDENWQRLKFIRGNEVYLTRNGLDKDNFEKGKDSYYHFILLAKDYIGYQQLIELSSRAWGRSYKHFMLRVPSYYEDILDVVGRNPGHLIASSACLGGELGQRFLKSMSGDIEVEEARWFAEAWVKRMVEIFGEGHFYIELQPGTNAEQVYVNRELWRLSKELGVPAIVTTDHHYTREEDRKIHKAFLTSKQGEREVDAFYEATFMMSREEIEKRLQVSFSEGVSEITQELFDNTNRINEMCEDYSLLRPLELPYLPREGFDLPLPESNDPSIARGHELMPNLVQYTNSSVQANRQFSARIHKFMTEPIKGGSRPRYTNPVVVERMNREIGIIWESGRNMSHPVDWSKYLLQVADYVNIFWNEGDSILAPSRGSAGASYVAHALGINQIDPTREKAPLIAERFINPDRASVVDIDMDVESTKREQCIQALRDEYGADRVIKVATFKTEKARSAILTAGRALGMDVDTTRYIASLCKAPRGLPYNLTQMYYGDIEEELLPNAEFVKQMTLYPDLWEVAYAIEGLVTGLGAHAGGVIISESPIRETCGIMRTSGDDFVTSFDLHELEELSLIKIDALATEGLSKIRTAMDLLIEYGYMEDQGSLRETYEKYLGVYSLDRDSAEMWKMVHSSKVISLFQLTYRLN